MCRKKSIFLLCCGLLFSASAFSQENNTVSKVKYFSASNAHSVNKTLISDSQCQTLLPSKWTKGTYELTKGKVTAINLSTFQMTEMDSLVIQPGVYDASTKTTPAENTPVKNIRHGVMHFTLKEKAITAPVVLTTSFPKGTQRQDRVYSLESSYCSATFKTKSA